VSTTREPVAASGSALAKLGPELEEELRRAVEELERGEYRDLSEDELDRWADAGAAPWPDAFPG
jgi:hypothetical protein